jgi:hypothetical protein
MQQKESIYFFCCIQKRTSLSWAPHPNIRFSTKEFSLKKISNKNFKEVNGYLTGDWDEGV